MKDILVSELDPHKASGPDEIPTRLLKELAQELTPILTLFFQASLAQGEIPSDWKKHMFLQSSSPETGMIHPSTGPSL